MIRKEILITVKMDNLEGESGDNLVFKIPLKQLILILIKSAHAIAQDFKNPLRLYASNVFSTLELFMSVLDDGIEATTEEAPKKSGERKISVVGKKPSDKQLLDFRRNGVYHKDIAKVYRVSTSAVSLWYKRINKA